MVQQRVKLGLALACLVSTCPVAAVNAAAPIPTIVVPRKSFTEKYFDRRNIGSSATLIGWRGGPLAGVVHEPMVYVAGVRPTDATICITIQHVNGSYVGSALMPNPQRGGKVLLRLPATLFEKQHDIDAADLSLLARASDKGDCTSKSVVLTANWTVQPDDTRTNVFLSAALGSEIKLMIAGLPRPVVCDPLDDIAPSPRKNRQRYNTVCQVDLPKACHGDARFELIVDSGSGRGPPIAGTLRRDCP
jgi:hypothetical protein